MSLAFPDPQGLLQADRRLRTLARELVRDPGAADDLAQEAWLVALQSGPIRALPAWLGTVVRRMATRARRGAKRRGEHERGAARAEALPSPQEILAREEARRRLVEALLALEEPLRTTLVLRFLEDQPPRAVAMRMQVPVETVRSRTKRGLAELRARLDRSFGDRAAWCAVLLPFSRGAEALGASLAVLSLQKGLAVAAVLVLCVVGALRWRAGGGAQPPAEATPIATADQQVPRAEAPAEIVGVSEVQAARESVISAPASATGPGSLRVRVSWSDGTPAEGIHVLVRPDGSENPELYRREERTDPSGVARFPRLSAGRRVVQLDRGMLQPAEIAAGQETELAFALPRGFDVRGRVEDARGTPIAGAEIWMSSRELLVAGTLAARSAADGSFFLRAITHSVFAACASGYRPSDPRREAAEEGSEVELCFVLRRGAGDVIGTVVDSVTGQAVAGAFIGVGPRSAMEHHGDGWAFSLGTWARVARSDERGAFRVSGVAPGPCGVGVRTPGYSHWKAEVEIPEDGVATISVALLPEAAIAGHVLDEAGEPVAGISVVVGQGVEWLQASTRTGPDGSFRVGALEANATLEARVLGLQTRRCVASVDFLALPGKTFTWEARLGEMAHLAGRVLDEHDGPLAGWRVEIHDPRSGSGDVVLTDADGAFRFEDLRQREHSLEVEAPSGPNTIGHPSLVRTVVPSEEELVLRMPCERTPSVWIVGTFLDETGAPIPGAEVIPWPGSGGRSAGEECDPATGAFRVGPLPPGVWRLNLEAPGRPMVYLAARELAPGETWDCGAVRLERAGLVEARLRAVDVEIGDDLWLRIRQEGWWRQEEPAGDGAVRSARLPPGRYEIRIGRGNYDQVVVPFEIRSGETTVVDVPIRRGHLAIVAVEAEPDIEVELRLTREGESVPLAYPIGRAGATGRLSHSYQLSPGTYAVEAVARGKRVSGTLVVEPLDRTEPALVLRLP